MIRLLAFQTIICATSVMTPYAVYADQGKQGKLPATSTTPVPSTSLAPTQPSSNIPASASPSLTTATTCPLTAHSAADYACVEQESVTQGQVQIDGTRVPYTAQAGKFVLRNSEGAEKATLFYIAYTKTPQASSETTRRPITFCTNGGPGSSSVWLHMGLLGPMRVVLRDTEFTPPHTS